MSFLHFVLFLYSISWRCFMLLLCSAQLKTFSTFGTIKSYLIVTFVSDVSWWFSEAESGDVLFLCVWRLLLRRPGGKDLLTNILICKAAKNSVGRNFRERLFVFCPRAGGDTETTEQRGVTRDRRDENKDMKNTEITAKSNNIMSEGPSLLMMEVIKSKWLDDWMQLAF